VRLPGVVYVQTNRSHDVGDVESSKRQVLESSYDAPELGGVLYQRSGVRNKLRLDVDWSRARLAISHGRTLNGIQRVSALVKKQPVWAMLDGDVEEVVKRVKILHDKFLL
jgi:hypothetical protein